MRLWVPMLLSIVVASPVGGQEVPFGVESGYHKGEAVSFSAGAVDWAALVPDHVAAIPVPTTDEAVLSEFRPLIMFGDAEVAVSVPVPDELARRHHYLASAAGVDEMTVDSAHSVTRFAFNRQETRIGGRSSWGKAFGSTNGPDQPDRSGPNRPPIGHPTRSEDGSSTTSEPGGAARPEGGGFVFSSERPLRFNIRPSGLSADDLLLGGNTVQATPDGGYHGRGQPFWDIAAQYAITLEGSDRQWVFVQWEPDRELFEVGCAFRYSLFRIEDDEVAPTQIAWTSYGCDV